MNEQKIKYVSFFTNDSIYLPLAESLEKDFKTYNVDYYIERIEPPEENRKHSWGKICLRKPIFIQNQMKENPDSTIVWIDIDTKITRSLNEFTQFINSDFDFAVQLRPEPFACVLVCKNNEKVKGFISEWIKMNDQINTTNSYLPRNKGHDQNGLDRLIKTHDGTQSIKIHNISNYFVSKTPNSMFYEIQASKQVREHIKYFGYVK